VTQNIQIKNFNPHPALKDVIRSIVIVEVNLGTSPQAMEGLYMPSPFQNIFIWINTHFDVKKIDEPEFRKASSFTIVGPQLTPVKLKSIESHKVVIVVFQPGGLNRFLGIPLFEIYDDGFAGTDLIGKEIDELVEQCHYCKTHEELYQLVQLYFLRKLNCFKDELPLDKALQYLLNNYETPIEQIAGLACMSIRQFERKCIERLGMSPKTYARISRFSKAYNLFLNNTVPTWTEIAHQAGYYDQMHFIKDFKEFAKNTPSFISKEVQQEKIRFHLDWESY
jgi:AraC-like DNA-binding protein